MCIRDRFDGLCASRTQCFESAEIVIRASAQSTEDRNSDQRGLFQDESAPTLDRPKLANPVVWNSQERLDEERLAIGFYFSGHPLDEYENELVRLNVVTHAQAIEKAKSGRSIVQMAGVVRAVKMRRSKAGNPFAWVSISDLTGEFEITVFSEALNASRDLLEGGKLVLAAVSVEDRDGEVRLTCEGLRALDAVAAATTSQLRVFVNSKDALEGVQRRLASVKSSDMAERGQIKIVMQLPQTGREVEIALPDKVACTPAMRGALKAIGGVSDVELV